MSLLQTTGLTVAYGAVRAIDGVDLTIEQGTIHGVIGPNGAGKSTLMDALSGRVRPSEGSVMLRGTDITRRSPVWRRRNGIARSFQRTSVFPTMTVGEQIGLVGELRDDPDVGQIVEHLGLAHLLDVPCETIAYGDQRRVDLALALIGRPELLLLDEPAAGLSAEETDQLVDHIMMLTRERDLTVALVEHDVDAVFRCSDVVTVLDLGRVLVSGEPDAVRADDRVVTAYLGSAA